MDFLTEILNSLKDVNLPDAKAEIIKNMKLEEADSARVELAAKLLGSVSGDGVQDDGLIGLLDITLPEPEPVKTEVPAEEEPVVSTDGLPDDVKAFMEKMTEDNKAQADELKEVRAAQNKLVAEKKQAEMKTEMQGSDLSFLPGDQDQLASALLSVKTILPEEESAALMTAIKGVCAIAKDSDVISKIGSRKSNPVDGSAVAAFDAKVEQIMNEDKTEKPEASVKAMREHADLWSSAMDEKRAQA